MSAVEFAVGKGLLLHLQGFRKAPVGVGFDRFAEVLCECSISVEHATAVVESFDNEFPTVRDIRETAHNLRPKFEAKVNQRKEWEAQYGKPEPVLFRPVTAVQEAAITTVPRVVKDPVSPERRAELQAMIDHAVKELREERARAELGGAE
jgi:hypothetical protein